MSSQSVQTKMNGEEFAKWYSHVMQESSASVLAARINGMKVLTPHAQPETSPGSTPVPKRKQVVVLMFNSGRNPVKMNCS